MVEVPERITGVGPVDQGPNLNLSSPILTSPLQTTLHKQRRPADPIFRRRAFVYLPACAFLLHARPQLATCNRINRKREQLAAPLCLRPAIRPRRLDRQRDRSSPLAHSPIASTSVFGTASAINICNRDPSRRTEYRYRPRGLSATEPWWPRGLLRNHTERRGPALNSRSRLKGSPSPVILDLAFRTPIRKILAYARLTRPVGL